MYGLEDESAPWGQLSGYMARAQTFLRGRTPDEVHLGGVAVSWMLGEALPELQKHADTASLPDVVPIGPSITMLVHLRRHIAIHNMAYFPNASWSELLAAYAIDCIGQAHGAFQYKREMKEPESENQREIACVLDQKYGASSPSRVDLP